MATRGGKRPNAGRKPGSVNKITALKMTEQEIKEIKGSAKRAVTAAAVLGVIDEMEHWIQLLRSDDENIKFKALAYLTDQRDGKAKQKIEASGPDNTPMQADVTITFVKTGD